MLTFRGGAKLTKSEFVPAGTFISLNKNNVPVYRFDRKSCQLIATGAKGPVTEIRCALDIYERVKAHFEPLKDDPYFGPIKES